MPFPAPSQPKNLTLATLDSGQRHNSTLKARLQYVWRCALWKGSIASKGSTVPRAQSFRAAHFRRRVFATARLQLSVLRAGYQAPRSGTATHCKTPRVARTRCRRVGVTRRDGLQTILFVGRVSDHVQVRRYSLFDPFPPRFLDPFAAVAPGQQTPR